MEIDKSFKIDNYTIWVQRLDSDNVMLSFYQKGERLLEIPNGYKLYLLSDIGDRFMVQQPVLGGHILYWGRSYELRKDGVTKVSFIHSKQHEIIVT